MAGWLRRISEGKTMPRIIVVSGVDPSKRIKEVASVGAYAFLAKPLDSKKLLEVVAAALKEAPPASG